MNDLISKRAVLAKINLWANGELSMDKLIESIKKMSGGSLTDRPCEYCKNHVDGRCAAWDCTFDDVLSSSENPNKCEDAISRKAVLNTLENMDRALDEDRTVESYKDLLRECYKVLPSVTPKPKSECEHDHEILKAYSDGANAMLDNVRAEMDGLLNNEDSKMYAHGVMDCLEIIDKFMAEGSDKE